MTRLERLQAAREEAWQRHYEWDLKPTAFNLEKPGGIMFDIRAERLTRLDNLIERLKRRSQYG